MTVLDYIDSDIFTPVYQNKLPMVKTSNIDAICREIFYAVKSKEQIFVYGDYDMDGFCCVKVWDEVLSSLYDVPIVPFQYSNRMHNVDQDLLNQVSRFKGHLVIICDSGSSKIDHETVSHLVLNGYLPIIIDHHNWEGDYKSDSNYTLVFNSHEERELLGGHEISGAYASLLVCNYLCDKFFKHTLSFNAMVYALASMYSDVVDLATPPGRALYNVVSMIKMPGPHFMTAMNRWGYSYCKRFFGFIVAPPINACFRTERFIPLNRALDIRDRHLLPGIVKSIQEVHNESSSLTDTFVPLFSREKFGNILLCIHDLTEDTSILHIRNFSGLIATKISREEKCMVIAVIHRGNVYEGSYRDYFSRKMLDTFKLFCDANGHDSAFGLRFISLDDFKRHLSSLSGMIDVGASKDYTTISSTLTHTDEDIQALALYNEYMNVRPRIMIAHRCPYAKLVRSTQYRKFYNVGLPYQVSSSSPLLDGANILVEPTISSAVELRCVE